MSDLQSDVESSILSWGNLHLDDMNVWFEWLRRLFAKQVLLLKRFMGSIPITFFRRNL
jgi:hypothetical protein